MENIVASTEIAREALDPVRALETHGIGPFDVTTPLIQVPDSVQAAQTLSSSKGNELQRWHDSTGH
jgi:hypothetical protein